MKLSETITKDEILDILFGYEQNSKLVPIETWKVNLVELLADIYKKIGELTREPEIHGIPMDVPHQPYCSCSKTMNKEELIEKYYAIIDGSSDNLKYLERFASDLLTLLEEKVKGKINIHRELSRQYVGSIEDIILGISSENIHLFVIKNLEDVLQTIEELKK